MRDRKAVVRVFVLSCLSVALALALFVVVGVLWDHGLLDEYPRTELQSLERDRHVLVGRVLDLERENASLQEELERLHEQLSAETPY
jgi:hypothetical protein